MAQRTMTKFVRIYPRIAAWIALLVFSFCGASAAQAASLLEEWRSEIVATRMLAENDAQHAHEDALRLQANLPADATPADITRVLNVLARTEIYTAQTDAAANHAQLALTLSKKNADKVGQAEAYLAMSLNSVNQGRIDVMLDVAPRALEVLQGVDRPDLLGEAMLRVAMMYRRIGQFDESVTLCMQAMDIAKRSNDPMALLYAHQGLGISFDQSDRQAEALEHYKQMRDLARAVHAKQLEADANTGLASAIGNSGDLRAADSLIREAIATYRVVKVPFNIARGLFALAANLRQRGHLVDSRAPLDEAIALYEHYPNKIGLWWALIARSENNQTLGRLTAAQADGERAYALAQDIGQFVYRSDSARRMATLAAATGDHKQAYALSVEAADLAGKMAREKSSKRMAELAERYQTESKQRQIDELTRREQQRSLEQRWLWTVLGGSVLLLVVTAYFLLRLRRSNRRTQASNAQLRQSQDEIRMLNVVLEQRVQAQTAELRQQTRYLRTLVDTLPVSVWLKDTARRYLSINASSATINGHTTEQIIGKTDEELWPADIGKILRETDLDVMKARRHKMLELAVHSGSGAIVWQEIDTAPVIDEDGSVLGTVGVGRDISERKAMESALRESKKMLTEAQRIAHVGSWEMNLVDNVLSWSDEIYRIFEIDPQQFGASYEAFMNAVHPDDREMVDRTYKASLQNREHFEIEHRLLLPDGRIKYVFERCETAYDTDGNALRSVGTVQDITERKRMEEALAARERELRALAESSPGMMVSLHLKPDGSVCMPYASPKIYELFGLHPQNVAEDASPLLSLNHPADAQRVGESIAESARTMTPWHCEYRILHPTKGERWMEGNTNPQPHPDGGVIWYGYVHDITERKRMEAALKDSEARYRYHFNLLQSMLESASSVSVFALDREYRYLFFNKRHREGAKRIRGTEIAIGMNMLESLGSDEFREFCRQGFDRVLAGNSVSVESKEEIVRDGIQAYEYNENYGSPIFNDDGDVVGLTVFAINITERKRLEAELLASRNFLDSVIDSVSDPIFVKDRKHRWTLLNDAFCSFIGHPREALVGKSDYDFFPSEQADVFWEKDELVFESGESNLNEERFTTASGEEHYIQTRKTPFISGDGRQMLVGVIRDITNLKRYEAAREAALAEAQRLAKLRSEFIAHMSHELRTPLNGILGYAQMLGRDGKLDERQHASVEVIRQSGRHLLALIEDILDLARIESGRLELVKSDIPLARFLHVVAEIVGVRARQKSIEFICELPTDLPEGVYGDEKRLRQVLLNLLANAIKFTDHGKVILSVSRATPTRLAFAVKDTGVGIAEADREAIFQSFEQAGDVQQRLGGTGLGLTISRQLVRLMGGDIVVESRIGEGSTFCFEAELPAVDIAPVSLLPAQVATGYVGQRRKVLIVDGAAENRAVAVDLLGQMGFETFDACDGNEALEVAQSTLPDLILMDAAIPGMECCEMISRLRKLPGLAQVPVIVQTADAMDCDEQRIMDGGANAFLLKPVDHDKLLEQIASLLGLEWTVSMPTGSAASEDETDLSLAVPPVEEMQALHRLALLGNMRDIMQYAERIAALDARYQTFATRLRQLANGYQSKAILALVEQHLHIP